MTAIIATLISCIATIVNYFIFRTNYKASEEKRFNDNLNQILSISIQYPYLEDFNFICTWTKNRNSSDDKYLRYDTYCIYNFNFLDRLCKYYRYNRKKIEHFVHVKEIIRTHASWWIHPKNEFDNIEGYSKEFRDFINSYLEG